MQKQGRPCRLDTTRCEGFPLLVAALIPDLCNAGVITWGMGVGMDGINTMVQAVLRVRIGAACAARVTRVTVNSATLISYCRTFQPYTTNDMQTC